VGRKRRHLRLFYAGKKNRRKFNGSFSDLARGRFSFGPRRRGKGEKKKNPPPPLECEGGEGGGGVISRKRKKKKKRGR